MIPHARHMKMIRLQILPGRAGLVRDCGIRRPRIVAAKEHHHGRSRISRAGFDKPEHFLTSPTGALRLDSFQHFI
jgi:hypothetical protein